MKTIFWNVDTQYDFMRDDSSYKGKLPVPDARSIEGALKYITNFARKRNYQVVNTADWHNKDSKEISENPDFRITFPEHCMENTKGAEYIPATNPDNPYIINWHDKAFDKKRVGSTRNIVLLKDAFDVFAGNPHTDSILKVLQSDRAIVYGVATNVCVNYAVQGLLDRGIEVYVVEDAIKEIPGIPYKRMMQQWKKNGTELIWTLHGMLAEDVASYGMQGSSLENLLEDDKNG